MLTNRYLGIKIILGDSMKKGIKILLSLIILSLIMLLFNIYNYYIYHNKQVYYLNEINSITNEINDKSIYILDNKDTLNNLDDITKNKLKVYEKWQRKIKEIDI